MYDMEMPSKNDTFDNGNTAPPKSSLSPAFTLRMSKTVAISSFGAGEIDEKMRCLMDAKKEIYAFIWDEFKNNYPQQFAKCRQLEQSIVALRAYHKTVEDINNIIDLSYKRLSLVHEQVSCGVAAISAPIVDTLAIAANVRAAAPVLVLEPVVGAIEETTPTPQIGLPAPDRNFFPALPLILNKEIEKFQFSFQAERYVDLLSVGERYDLINSVLERWFSDESFSGKLFTSDFLRTALKLCGFEISLSRLSRIMTERFKKGLSCRVARSTRGNVLASKSVAVGGYYYFVGEAPKSASDFTNMPILSSSDFSLGSAIKSDSEALTSFNFGVFNQVLIRLTARFNMNDFHRLFIHLGGLWSDKEFSDRFWVFYKNGTIIKTPFLKRGVLALPGYDYKFDNFQFQTRQHVADFELSLYYALKDFLTGKLPETVAGIDVAASYRSKTTTFLDSDRLYKAILDIYLSKYSGNWNVSKLLEQFRSDVILVSETKIEAVLSTLAEVGKIKLVYTTRDGRSMYRKAALQPLNSGK